MNDWSEVQLATWDLRLVLEVGGSLVGLSPYNVKSALTTGDSVVTEL